MPAKERVREDHVHSRLSSTGSVRIETWINLPQRCSELDEASVQVAAADEGIRSTHFVERFEVAHALIWREPSRPRRGRIAVDDAHMFIAPLYPHLEKLE